MIQCHDIRFERAQRTILDGVSLSADASEVVVVVGPNGAGKSSQFRILAGDERPTSGAVSLLGRDVASAPPMELARLRAVMPQESTLAFPFTAGTGLPATNQVYTAGTDISFNGYTFQIDGNPAAGDIFTVTPNKSGSADNRNMLLLGILQTTNTLENGSATFQSAYGQLVSQIGNKTRELEVTSKAQANLLAQTEKSIQSISGVNLDEEAAKLMRFQQAFQASSKVIEISNSLFDSILRIG